MIAHPLESFSQSSSIQNLRSILLVEDNPVFQLQLNEILSKIAPQATTYKFASGLKAIRAIKNKEFFPELALIDIGLPDINGITVIQILNDISPETSILVISILKNEDNLLKAIRAGAKGYLLKGESSDVLTRGIQEVLDGNYPISPLLARSLFKLAGAPKLNSVGGKEMPTLSLTPRERETLQRISQGLTYLETSNALGVSLSTVQTHVKNLYRKLGVKSQTQAIIKAQQAGVI